MSKKIRRAASRRDRVMSSERDRAYMLLSRAYAKDLRGAGNAEQAELADLIDEMANAIERMVNDIESARGETGARPGDIDPPDA
jgi:hypothetical protein